MSLSIHKNEYMHHLKTIIIIEKLIYNYYNLIAIERVSLLHINYQNFNIVNFSH